MNKIYEKKWNNFLRKVFPIGNLPVHPLYLNFRFSQDESEFTEQYYPKIIKRLRWMIAITTFIILSLQFIDYGLTGIFMNDAFIIRFEIFLPFSLFFFLLSFTSFYLNFYQYINVLWLIMAGLGGILTIILGPEITRPIIITGLVLFLVGSFILFGLKPHFALISSSILLICLLWALIYENILNSLYTWPIILLSLITLFIGYYGGWKIEFLQRKLYWSLKQQKELSLKILTSTS